MNTHAPRLTILLFASLSAVSLADDKRLAVDETGPAIVIHREKVTQVIRVEPKTEILLNNKKAELRHLKPGANLRVKLAETQTATRIEATGVMSATAPTAEKVLINSLTVRARVDGTDVFNFNGESLRIDHEIFKVPEELLLNGREWAPAWQGTKTAEFHAFTPPLAPTGTARPSFKKISGRARSRWSKTKTKKLSR